MQRGQRRRRNAGPLLVTEVILPKNEKPGTSNRCLENVIDFKSGEKEAGNSSTGCLIINNHEIKPVGRLISLEKNNQEPYFRGTKQKKVSKRKSKKQLKKNELLLFEDSQSKVLTEEGTNTVKTGIKTQPPTEKSLSFKEILERNKLKQKICEYEKFRKQSDRKNQIKQRLAEKNYIEKYENLAETWLELMKRRKQLKQEGFKCFQPPYKERYNNRITISIFPKKFWSPDECVNEKKETTKKEEVDELTLDKLVFVDEESSDES